MIIKALLYQQELLGRIPPEDYSAIKAHQPDFLCLPEYFFHPGRIALDAAKTYMARVSRDLNCALIGGSAVLEEKGKSYNACFVFEKGRELGHYRKIHLYYKEEGKITPGNGFRTFNAGPWRIGVLICADVLFEDAWLSMASFQADIIFVPTYSPFKNESVQEKFERDHKIFVQGAKSCHCPVVKVCSIGGRGESRVQGRSLVASPRGIIWRVPPEQEDRKIIKTVELKL